VAPGRKKQETAHRWVLGVLIKKISAPRFNFFLKAPNRVSTSTSCFGSGNGVAFATLSARCGDGGGGVHDSSHEAFLKSSPPRPTCRWASLGEEIRFPSGAKKS
jgi:hypothetical protein